jgi:DNA-binding GntR family transcriptional regulator
MPLPSQATPIPRRSARHDVYERLRTWIEEGVLSPGEAIKDAEVASALGVSRTPVREALQMLEQQGAVEMLPGRVTRVTDTTPDDIAMVYSPLSALQALAAELGTPRATEEDIRAMTAANERLLAAVDAGDKVAARDADAVFHGVLLRLAANPYLDAAIEPMQMHIRRLEARYFADAEPGHDSYAEHRAIIDAVAAGDAEGARETARRNFQRYWKPEDDEA